jgi:hypothetical protein
MRPASPALQALVSNFDQAVPPSHRVHPLPAPPPAATTFVPSAVKPAPLKAPISVPDVAQHFESIRLLIILAQPCTLLLLLLLLLLRRRHGLGQPPCGEAPEPARSPGAAHLSVGVSVVSVTFPS